LWWKTGFFGQTGKRALGIGNIATAKATLDSRGERKCVPEALAFGHIICWLKPNIYYPNASPLAPAPGLWLNRLGGCYTCHTKHLNQNPFDRTFHCIDQHLYLVYCQMKSARDAAVAHIGLDFKDNVKTPEKIVKP